MGKCRREGSRRDWISDFIFTSLLARHGTFFLHDDHREKQGVVLSYPTALRSPDPGLLSSKNDSYKKDATMTHGTLIVLEGIDGSGKATQSALLEKKLKEAGKDVMHISFPDYASDSSALVKMYLNGDFGADPGDVNPYAASLFYAVDRFASYRMKWKDFYEKGGIIIADRYTTSNMVHQMTKYDDEEERTQFLSWLEKTEYEELELPRPDLVILLDIPLGMSEALVKARAAEGGSMDIHEQHLDYLRKCHDAYQALVRFYGWERIPCAREGVLRSVTDIGHDVDAAVEKVMKNRK